MWGLRREVVNWRKTKSLKLKRLADLGTSIKLKPWSLKLETSKWKVETGKLQNRVRVERIRPSSSRSVATAHGWMDGILLGSRSQLHLGVGSNRSRRCGRLTAHGWLRLHLAATDRDFFSSWQQQIRLVVVGWWLQTCRLRLPCSVVKLFELVSCGWQRVYVCVLGLRVNCWDLSDCAACVCVVQLVCVLFCFVLFCHSMCVLCKCAASACDLWLV